MSRRALREAPPVEVVRAPNGLTFILKENHATPIISLALYTRGGFASEDEARQGITGFMQRLLMKGTATRDADTIADELESLGASMSPFTGKDVLGASLSSLSRHFPAALEVFTDCLLRPSMPPDNVARERQIIISDIEKRKDDTLSYCLERCERVLFEGHPYCFPISGCAESLSAVTVDDLQAWHARTYRADRVVAALVGDFETARARELLLEAFAGLPSADEALPGHAPPRPFEGLREIRETRDKRQVAVALGFHAPPFPHPDYPAFDVLDHVLSGMGSRLFIELRDRQGLGYVVSSSFDSRLEVGGFKMYIATSEDRRERAREAMLEQLRLLRDEAVGDEEMARTRQYMLGLNEIALQRNGAQASRLAYYEIMGLGWRLLDAYPALIAGVQGSDVQRVARRYLDLERHAVAEILAP